VKLLHDDYGFTSIASRSFVRRSLKMVFGHSLTEAKLVSSLIHLAARGVSLAAEVGAVV
jgi:hypothetical protein